MANNLVEYLAQLKTKDPNRANWIMDCPNVGTNDFGFYKVKLCKEIIAGTNVRYDFKSAYSTNPTICPVLSRAKVQVIGIWIPSRLYIPALRDGAQVKAGKSDYAFPTINFAYKSIYETYQRALNDEDENYKNLVRYGGHDLPYIPANSIYSELGMWAPYFQPIGFAHLSENRPYPEAKNAIPLLGYLDFYRHYVINNQNDTRIPIRTKGFSKYLGRRNPNTGIISIYTQEAGDYYATRDDFDNLFKSVRQLGSSYPQGEGTFDITGSLTRLFTFPYKKVVPEDPENTRGGLIAFNDNHFGELRATYLSDFYTAYLSNENVEYERSTARVQVDDEGYITMEQIYSAEKVQNFVRRSIFKNSDYADYIDAHYGVRPSTDLTKPLFLGATSTWLSFNDVVAQAQTSSESSDISSNTDLGSRASIGFGRMVTGKLRSDNERNFINFTAREPGYFMVLEVIIPEVTYWQGFDPLYDKRSLNSLYYPDFDKDGYQDKQVKYIIEQMPDFNNIPPSIYFDEYNLAYAQEPAWWEYMTTYGKLSGQMVEPGVYRHWTFSRTFNGGTIMTSGDGLAGSVRPNMNILVNDILNTYVTPEDYNSIFANINGIDNFQTYYRHELKLYQPLSHRFLSFN